jgi:hypothetical protein
MQTTGVSWTDIGSFAVLVVQLIILAVAAVVAWGQVREARMFALTDAAPHAQEPKSG